MNEVCEETSSWTDFGGVEGNPPNAKPNKVKVKKWSSWLTSR